MLPTGHYYPDQPDAGEHVVLFVRRHWFAFMPWIILIAFMAIVPLFFFVPFISSSQFTGANLELRTLTVLVASAYALFTLSIFIVAWIDYYFDVTIVTRQRLIDIRQNGLFNRQVSEQSLLRVQDVSARVRGPLQTFLRYGTVYVETAGEAPNFVMPNLPSPNVVASTIIELHRQLVEAGSFTTGEAEAEGIFAPSHQGTHRPDHEGRGSSVAGGPGAGSSGSPR